MGNNKKVVILGGGVSAKVAVHFDLSVLAYGGTARRLENLFHQHPDCKFDIETKLSKMAGGNSFETIDELSNVIDELVNDLSVKIIVMNCAIPNFVPEKALIDERIETTDNLTLSLKKAPKVVNKIRTKGRKDIFLISTKTTYNASPDEMFAKGLKLMKESSSNLVLVNDLKTRKNMIITPEEATYHYSDDRDYVLENLVDIAIRRSHLTFTRSTVVSDEGIDWNSEKIPNNLREVVNYCIDKNAYKEGYEGSGATVGHFACKLDDTTFITSKRKTNFNDLEKIGMVLIKTDGEDSVLAYGGKPSVGGQSQRIIFREHENTDCIVHFHCPMKANSSVPSVSQREYECGSHECGQNTSNGLAEFVVDNQVIKAVFLEKHGPNIVFSKDAEPSAIIKFIEDNFDLSQKTDGYI